MCAAVIPASGLTDMVPGSSRPGRLYNIDAWGVSVGWPGVGGEGGVGGDGGLEQVQHDDGH